MSSGPDDEDVAYYGDGGEALDAPESSLAAVIDAGGDYGELDVELCQLPENDLANAKRLAKTPLKR